MARAFAKWAWVEEFGAATRAKEPAHKLIAEAGKRHNARRHASHEDDLQRRIEVALSSSELKPSSLLTCDMVLFSYHAITTDGSTALQLPGGRGVSAQRTAGFNHCQSGNNAELSR